MKDTKNLLKEKIKKDLIIYLWGKPVEADVEKDAEIIMPFILRQISKAKNRGKNEVWRKIKKLP